MRKVIFKMLVVTAFSIVWTACTKAEGEGGTSTIRGKVYAKYYNKTISTVTTEGYAPKESVYIIYGDDVTYGNNQSTNYDGYYEFKYLRPGKYKVFAYSRDSTGAYKGAVNINAPVKAIVKEVEIKSGNEIVEVADISIIK